MLRRAPWLLLALALAACPAPLSGGKRKLYEGGIRVPRFARWPAGLPTGAVFSEVVQGMDLFPTLLSAAGLPDEARADGVEGVDLLPFVYVSAVQARIAAPTAHV